MTSTSTMPDPADDRHWQPGREVLVVGGRTYSVLTFGEQDHLRRTEPHRMTYVAGAWCVDIEGSYDGK